MTARFSAGPDASAVMEWVGQHLPSSYLDLVQDVLDEAGRDPAVSGVLLSGSLARGDALPGTDVDLRLISRKPIDPRFRRESRSDITLERGWATESEASSTLQRNPMHVYAYLDGCVLHDEDGSLQRLAQQARRLVTQYRTPPERRTELVEALHHPQTKIEVGLQAGDVLRAAYSLGTATWQIIEGLWAANDLPTPPNASVRAHIRDLSGPPNIAATFADLFLLDATSRAETGLELIGWIRRELSRT